MHKLGFATLIGLSALMMGSQSPAAIVINTWQDGPDVFSEFSGDLNIDGLPSGGGADLDFIFLGDFNSFLSLEGSVLTFGPDVFSSVVGSNGATDLADTTLRSGDNFGVTEAIGETLFLPAGYTTGAPLSGSMTFANTTLGDLGLTDGAQVIYTLNSSAADTITWNISSTAPGPVIPLPAGFPLIAGALGALALLRRRG